MRCKTAVRRDHRKQAWLHASKLGLAGLHHITAYNDYSWRLQRFERAERCSARRIGRPTKLTSATRLPTLGAGADLRSCFGTVSSQTANPKTIRSIVPGCLPCLEAEIEDQTRPWTGRRGRSNGVVDWRKEGFQTVACDFTEGMDARWARQRATLGQCAMMAKRSRLRHRG